MTIGYLWGLIATIGFFAFTLVLEVVKLTRSLKSSDDELASARQKIATLDEKHNETIADLKELHQKETEELRKKIAFIKDKNANKKTDEEYDQISRDAWNAHT